MLTVIRHGMYYDPEAKYFRFFCSCGCEFVGTRWDLKGDTEVFKLDNNKMYAICPDCGEKNFISTSNFIMPPNSVSNKICYNSKLVEDLTVEEYNKLINPPEKTKK